MLNTINAQTYFNKEYTNDSSNTNNGHMVYQYPDTTGYLIIGNFAIPGFKAYLRFTRINVLGDTVWTKHYRNRSLAQGTTSGDYINIGDTNIVFAGIYAPQTSDSMQVNLFKIDTAGNVLWDYVYGDAGKHPPPMTS